MNKKKSILSNAIIYSFGEILPRLLSFILLPIYTKYLSPSDYGIISYTNSFALFIFVFSVLSLNSFVLRHYFEIENESSRKKLIGNVFVFLAIFNIIFLGFLALGFKYLSPLLSLKVNYNPFLKLMFLNLFFEVFAVVPLVFYRVKSNAIMFTILNVSKTFIQLLLITFLIKGDMGIMGHYYGKLYVNILYFVFYIVIILKYAEINLNLTQIKEGLKFSFPLIPAVLSVLIINVSDRIILERYVSLGDIGIYNIAFVIGYSLNIIIQGGFKSIEPELYMNFKEKNFYLFFDNIKKIFFALIIFVGFVISIFSFEIINLVVSDAYCDSYQYVPLIILGTVFSGFGILYSSICIASKQTKIIAKATILGSVISIMINIILIPKLGLFAPAISYIIASIIMFVMVFRYVHVTGKSFKIEGITLALGLILFSIIGVVGQSIDTSYKYVLKLIIVALYLLLVLKLNSINKDKLIAFFKKI